MTESTGFLRDLAFVLCVAAVTTVVFQRLRQPVVFGYLLAGMIIGPHIPIPLAVNANTVHTLSELGVILLMFGLGLEFKLRKLLQVVPTAGIIAVIQASTMFLFGYMVGQGLGWTTLESIYTGAMISVSSTTIIVKAFAEQRATGRYTELVYGILIIEDLIAIFLVAILTAISHGNGVSATSIGMTAARLVLFLIGLLGVGLLLIPRFVRSVISINRPETTLIASVGICFAAALLALAFGYSVALGAFIAGSLVSESGEEKTIEPLVAPVRDLFVAIFFVAVGMMIDPVLIAQHWGAVLILATVVILGNVIVVSTGTFLVGFGTRTAVQTGMSLAQIGEFSFIIAGVGLAAGVTRSFLYPVAIAVSALTTLTTPWLIRASGPAASYVDRKLPQPLQTFMALHGSWMERLRSAPREPVRHSRIRRLMRLMVIDIALLLLLVIGTSVEMDRLSAVLTVLMGFTAEGARLMIVAGAVLVAIPLLVGLVRTARVLGFDLATRALPVAEDGNVDVAAAPRRMFLVVLQLMIVCLVGVPIVAITQPFLPPYRGTAAIIIILAALGVAFWRNATNLHGHARAGAEVIVATLTQQMAKGDTLTDDESDEMSASLEQVNNLLPGLGEPVRVRIAPNSTAVDRTLAQLNLRSLTGATVLAITRSDSNVVLPVGREVLHAGDVLALAGTYDAVQAARELLRPASVSPAPDVSEETPMGG
jgi:CPA2 family monovalent cation:H+ antiporter-2